MVGIGSILNSEHPSLLLQSREISISIRIIFFSSCYHYIVHRSYMEINSLSSISTRISHKSGYRKLQILISEIIRKHFSTEIKCLMFLNRNKYKDKIEKEFLLIPTEKCYK